MRTDVGLAADGRRLTEGPQLKCEAPLGGDGLSEELGLELRRVAAKMAQPQLASRPAVSLLAQPSTLVPFVHAPAEPGPSAVEALPFRGVD